MRKFLPLLIFPIFVLLTLPFDAFGASVDVSKSSSFSSSDLNFSGGETVYVRIKINDTGSSHVLNIKDSNYSTISSVNLNRSGDSYTANFSAPGSEGYYSLEVKIEGDGTSVTSVKTIKVGSPTGANIKVNVNSSVKGTKTGSSDNSEDSDESDKSDRSEDSEESEDQNSRGAEQNIEVYSAQDRDQTGDKPNWIWAIVKGVFSWLWPF